MSPTTPSFDEFVAGVMASWRAGGSEPNVALDLVRYLGELGCDVREARPIIDVLSPRDAAWRWPASFIDVNLRRMMETGHVTPAAADQARADFARLEAAPHARMVTPIVMEIIATRRV